MCLGKHVKAHTTDCSIVNQQMYLRTLLQKPPGKAPDGGHRAQVYLPKQKAGILRGCLDLSQGLLSTLSATASKDHPGPTAGQLLGHNLSDTCERAASE